MVNWLSDILNLRVFLKVPTKKGITVYLSMMKEHDMAIVTLGFSPWHLLLALRVVFVAA